MGDGGEIRACCSPTISSAALPVTITRRTRVHGGNDMAIDLSSYGFAVQHSSPPTLPATTPPDKTADHVNSDMALRPRLPGGVSPMRLLLRRLRASCAMARMSCAGSTLLSPIPRPTLP